MSSEAPRPGFSLGITALFLVVSAPVVFWAGWGLGGRLVMARLRQLRYREPRAQVLVAARAMPAGHALTYDDVAARKVPTELVTADDVPVDSAIYVVGQPVGVPVAVGDTLRWSLFTPHHKASPDTDAAFRACARAYLSASGGRDRLATVRQLRARVLKEAR